MKCLRCGECCKTMFVPIVDDPARGPAEDNIVIQEGLKACKHLLGDKPGEYACVLHDEPWYQETPCFRHGQVEWGTDTPCRYGKYVLKNREIREKAARNLIGQAS